MKRAIITLAALAFAATACTPQEVAFWRTFHDEHPAEAEQLLTELGLVETPNRVPGLTVTRRTDWPADAQFSASAECPWMVHITNTDTYPYSYSAQYGSLGIPLVMAPTGALPEIDPGSTVTIDISAAAGDFVWVWLGNGLAFEVTGAC